MMAIYRRELRSYFRGVTGWLFSAFLLLFVGIYTMVYCLANGYPNFEYVMGNISFIFLICVPILTMRVFAEEKHRKTDQLLYSLPVSLSSVVLGKYLAMVTVLAVPALIACVYPLVLTGFSTVSLKLAYASIFFFFLLGACLLAVGMFISSVTDSQVASAVISLVAMLILYFMSGLASYVSTDARASVIALMVLSLVIALAVWLLTRSQALSIGLGVVLVGGLFFWYGFSPDTFSGLFPKMMEQISVFDRFYTIVDGMFDWTATVYYLSIIGVFVFLTVQSLEKRRWS